MVSRKWVARMWQHIRSTQGMVTVELALGLTTLTFVFLMVLSALAIFLTQLQLIDVAHNSARLAARGEVFVAPDEIEITQQYQAGIILVQASRDLSFWFRPIYLTAKAEVVVE